MSLTNTFTTERKYESPKIKKIASNRGMGSKTIVQEGMNWKTGKSPRKIPTLTKAKIPAAVVATIGKISLFTFIDCKMLELEVKLINPPTVPREKI